VYSEDWTGSTGRPHHVASATDTRENILKAAADIFLANGIFIESGPHKHAIQQTFFRYVYEPGGNRVEFCNPGARLILAPDRTTIEWTEAERRKGQAWGMKTIETFHTHGTPPVEVSEGP
jgi:catechol 2,3-dioxygenase